MDKGGICVIKLLFVLLLLICLLLCAGGLSQEPERVKGKLFFLPYKRKEGMKKGKKSLALHTYFGKSHTELYNETEWNKFQNLELVLLMSKIVQ